MILSPVKSRKAKEQNDGNASEKVVIARCPLVFTGGHRGGVATGLLSWLAVDACFALSGRSDDGVLDALRQRRIVAASGDQLLAGVDWLFNWRIAGVDSGTDKRTVALGRTAAGYLNSDVAQRAASGADPAGDLWFGIDESAKIFLVALGTLFPIYINTWHGIRNIDRGLVEMARSYGLSGIPLFIHVILPGALPSIMVGVRFALGLMWLTLIVAETISANSGIGYLAMNAREFLQTDVVVVAIILYALLGKLADVSAQLLERLWLRWNPAYHLKEATV